MKKIIVASILFLGFTISSFSQSQKLQEKVNDIVKELNSEIIAGDKSQALSDEQKVQIYTIHIERLKELNKAKKNGADKSDKKEINKKYFQKIYKEVLTKDQLKARKKGKTLK